MAALDLTVEETVFLSTSRPVDLQAFRAAIAVRAGSATVFMRYHRSQRERFDGVPRRKALSPFEEVSGM